jgi:hypothetical protein
MADFTLAQSQVLSLAIQLITAHPAHEFPPDSTVLEQVARVAFASGFTVSTGAFLEKVKDSPISTLLAFVKFLGWDVPGIPVVTLVPTLAHPLVQANINPTAPLSAVRVDLHRVDLGGDVIVHTFTYAPGDNNVQGFQESLGAGLHDYYAIAYSASGLASAPSPHAGVLI